MSEEWQAEEVILNTKRGNAGRIGLAAGKVSAWPVTALVMLAVMVAGCGGSPAATKVATAGPSPSVPTARPSPSVPTVVPSPSVETGAGRVRTTPTVAPLPETAAPAAERVRVVPSEGRDHVQEGTAVTYKHNPPTSGPHYPLTVRYGVYEEVIPEGYWVHNLEHGAIVVLYRCPEGEQTCPEVTEQLEGLMKAAPPSAKWDRVKLVATQYPGLRTPYAMLAWNHIQYFNRFDQKRMLAFYRKYVDKGPESAP